MADRRTDFAAMMACPVLMNDVMMIAERDAG
jgi:hypothetical protein